MSSKAFYCSLCKVFTGDGACAEEHLKSEAHNENYRVSQWWGIVPTNECKIVDHLYDVIRFIINIQLFCCAFDAD